MQVQTMIWPVLPAWKTRALLKIQKTQLNPGFQGPRLYFFFVSGCSPYSPPTVSQRFKNQGLWTWGGGYEKWPTSEFQYWTNIPLSSSYSLLSLLRWNDGDREKRVHSENTHYTYSLSWKHCTNSKKSRPDTRASLKLLNRCLATNDGAWTIFVSECDFMYVGKAGGSP